MLHLGQQHLARLRWPVMQAEVEEANDLAWATAKTREASKCVFVGGWGG